MEAIEVFSMRFFAFTQYPFLHQHILLFDWSIILQNFGEYNLWLAAEHGMFLRRTTGDWMTTMPESLNMDWVDSVKVRIEKS